MDIEIRHGSHPHPLKRVQGALHEFASTNTPMCSICSAAFTHDAIAWVCVPCRFLLCHKCQQVDERPFNEPQVVLRNPQLDLQDRDVCLRTRPRSTGHRLNILYPDVMMEVVAYCENKEEGCTYFRQQQGGWLRAKDVVCVSPSSTPMTPLANVRMQYALHGSADLLEPELLIDTVDQAIDLLDADPRYGCIMAYFTLLPLQLFVSNDLVNRPSNAWDKTCQHIASRAVKLCGDGLRQAVDEVVAAPPTILHETNVQQHLGIRLATRCIAVLWHLQPLYGDLQPELTDLLQEAMSVLANVLNKSHTPPGNNDQCQVVMQQWYASDYNQNADVSERETLSMAMASVNISLILLLQLEVPCQIGNLSPVRALLGSHPELTEHIATNVVQMASLMAKASGHSPEVQQHIINLDLVEVAVRKLRFTFDDGEHFSALNLLMRLLDGNGQVTHLLHRLLVPPVIKVLKNSKSVDVCAAALDCLAAMARSTDDIDSSAFGEDAAPRCSTAAYTAAAYQPMAVIKAEGAAPIALCSTCASGSCGFFNPEQSEVSVTYRMMLGRCQCYHCAPGIQPIANANALRPMRHPTELQECFMQTQIVSCLVNKIRAFRSEIVDSVSRVALELCSGSEELALEVASTLETYSVESLAERFPNAALLVGGCRAFPQVQRYLRRAPAGTALVQYVVGCGGDVSPQRAPMMMADPAGAGDEPGGLTPTPWKPAAEYSISVDETAVALFPQPR